MPFYEAVWRGEGIGDGNDLEEALQSFSIVNPENVDWTDLCSSNGVNPHVNRYLSFDDYLDNADALEMIPVTSLMITNAIDQLTM